MEVTALLRRLLSALGTLQEAAVHDDANDVVALDVDDHAAADALTTTATTTTMGDDQIDDKANDDDDNDDNDDDDDDDDDDDVINQLSVIDVPWSLAPLVRHIVWRRCVSAHRLSDRRAPQQWAPVARRFAFHFGAATPTNRNDR